MKDLEKRVEQLEKEVAAIKRIRIVSANLSAQEVEDEVNGKLMKPSAGKSGK